MPLTIRPCLKHEPSSLDYDASLSTASQSPFPFAACSSVHPPTRVRFPPSPALTSTRLTHSSRSYDRAPIVVGPNTCALPERGGRTYTAESSHRRSPPPASGSDKVPKGSYFHSKPPAVHQPEHYSRHHSSAVSYDPIPIPSLVHDISSSESDESDTSVTTPPGPSMYQQHLLPPINFQLPNTAHERNPDGKAFMPVVQKAAEGRCRDQRKRSPSRTRGVRRSKKSEFAAPDLDDDGCLGGF